MRAVVMIAESFSMSLSSSLESQGSDIKGDGLSVVLVPLGEREAEVQLHRDVAELGDEEPDAEAHDVAPLLVAQALEVGRQVREVVEEGAAEELDEDRIAILHGGQD